MLHSILIACITEEEKQDRATSTIEEDIVDDSATDSTTDTDVFGLVDLDQDGYPDWRGTDDWLIADCDDGDPLVTPASERLIFEGVFIHGGPFPFTSPQLDVYLSSYCMDVYEIRNSEFVEFMFYQKEQGYDNQTVDGQPLFDFDDDDDNIPERIHRANGFSVYSGYQDHPVVEVWRWSAEAYCEWKEKKLPTEAEWEKGARGIDGRSFPWGEVDPTCDLANFGTSGNQCVSDTSVVGSYPAGASPYGLLDMAGNAAEFVQDWFLEDYYASAPTENPQGPEYGFYNDGQGNEFQAIAIRSGNYATVYGDLRTYARTPEPFDATSNGLGFRCSRELVP